jgi:hypothetical protein
MTKKDFVTAWLLASRAAGDTFAQMELQLEKAERTWEFLEQRYAEEDA